LSSYQPEFHEPILIVKNISRDRVDVLGAVSLLPGETREIFSSAMPSNRDDLLTRAARELTPPNGQLYLSVMAGAVEVLDFRIWANSVDETQIRTSNSTFPGAVLAFDGTNLLWSSPGAAATPVQAPLVNDGMSVSIPRATALADGYLSKDDYQYIFASIRRKQRMWQYQDFAAPLGTSLEITAFQNGTGLTFDPSYVINDTAAIVLQSDLDSPPLSTTSFPVRLLPGSRVKVSTHISDTVILNQAPAAASACRVYFLISLPDGVLPPYDYQEAPQFLKSSPGGLLDENYLNQNQDETAYGVKTFAQAIQLDDSFVYPTGATDGYTMYSDATGKGYWGPAPVGGGGGGGVTDPDLLVFTEINLVGGQTITSVGTELVFTDSTGTASLTTLKSMRNVWADGYGYGDLIISDATNWAATYTYVSAVHVASPSTDWDLWLYEDAFVNGIKIASFGMGTMTVDVGFECNSIDTNIRLRYLSNDGNLSAAYIRVSGEARRH